MKAILAAFFILLSSQTLIAGRQPDCNHETLQEARDREAARHH